jgi:hypothetical protein
VLLRRSLLALLLLVLAVPARAAGTGGIEVSPYPGVVDGHQVTAFHVKVPRGGSSKVTYSLRNTTNHPVHGRLYAASATPDGHNGWTVGGAGTSRYVDLPDQQTSLKPHETRLQTFTVHGKVDGTQHAAIVVEVKQGSVVTPAATLVYLERGRRVPLPVLVVGAAVLLLLAASVGVVLMRRRRPATEG